MWIKKKMLKISHIVINININIIVIHHNHHLRVRAKVDDGVEKDVGLGDHRWDRHSVVR